MQNAKGLEAMNILCIGNSFSQNATRYLHQIARKDGKEINIVNLFIGGCTLDRHFRNMLSEKAEYLFYFNGIYTGFKLSIKEAILSREWDYITVQQASHKSPKYENYQPYLNELVAYVRKCAPKTKVLIHQTWAYLEGSEKLTKTMGYATPQDMFADIKDAYDKALKDANLDGLIPSGALFQELIKENISPIHSDPIHASKGIGQYALALLWYRYLTGADVTNDTFCDFDEEIPAETIAKIKECVMRTEI